MPAPSLPLPPPVTGENEGTWAHSTITVRLPEIAGRVLDENDLPRAQTDRIRQLIEQIPGSPIRPLQDRRAPDHDDWRAYSQPYLGLGWLEIPWFFIETYFYRRILSAVDYFSAARKSRIDPFALQKRRGMDQMGDLLDRYQTTAGNAAAVLDLSLWGNQSDLSLWPAGEDDRPNPGHRRDQSEFLLQDDLEAVQEYLDSQRGAGPRFSIVLDNVGIELAADLELVRYLLKRWPEAEVHLHAKAHPTFVSDATRHDVIRSLAVLARSSKHAHASLGTDLQQAIRENRLVIHDHPFWTSPLALWEMPPDLYRQFSNQDLIILKGDANYRRALGDLHWPISAPFDEIMAYMPASLLALRTLKSELACGLDASQAERAARSDRDWMTNGRWAVRQFYRRE